MSLTCKEIKTSSPGMCLLTNIGTHMLLIGSNLLLSSNSNIELIIANNWCTYWGEHIIYGTDML